MNNNFNNQVGLDPSKVETIENLDILPGQAPTPEKKPTPIKKILFIVLIVVLMAGVGFGVWYYLNLGTKNAKTKNGVVFKEVVYYLGDTLSTNVDDYATFTGVDKSSCSLNLLDVNTKEAGEYKYTITCDNKTYEGNLTVKKNDLSQIKTKIVYKLVGEDVVASDFVESTDEYTYEIAGSDLTKEKGVKNVEITLKNENSEETVKAILVVLEEKMFLNLKCTKDNVTDSFAFKNDNGTKTDLKSTLRLTNSTFESSKDYAEYVKNATDEYYLIDNINSIYTKVEIVDYSTFESNFPNERSAVAKYYTDKEYTCSF